MSRKELTDLLIKYGKKIGEKNMSPGTSGNLSCRYNEKILITASGSANGDLSEDEILLMDFDGNKLDDTSKKLSSEKFLHIEIYKHRFDVNVVLHVHSPYLSSFAAAHIPLDKPIMAENTFYFGDIPSADYALPSSIELAQNTVKCLKNRNAALMANHGFVIVSDNIKDAYQKLEIAESYAQLVSNTYLLGVAKTLYQQQVDEIIKLK